MFRYEENYVGDWREKTMHAMRQRRFERCVSHMKPLSEQRLEALSTEAFRRRLESCWQEIEKKPLRSMQMLQIKERVLSSIEIQAACLSKEEHDLVERALILGGSVPLDDAQELEAARALSLRLWANVGLVAGKPWVELEGFVLRPAAKALSRGEHERIRLRFDAFQKTLSGLLYRSGAIDDRLPQQIILREVLQNCEAKRESELLARRYLWASCDCVDYSGGVMLVHQALAEPGLLINAGRRTGRLLWACESEGDASGDILPEEIPLQKALERTIDGALRVERTSNEVAQEIRFLCKQGAPLEAMEQVLQSSLIVYVNETMRSALEKMFYQTPKWVYRMDHKAVQ